VVSQAQPRVAGVDGCRTGWVVAEVPAGGRSPTPATVTVIDHFASIVERIDDPDDPLVLVGVDMPVGLLDAGRRACDVQARARLGPRRSSIFPTPVRAALHAPDYATALAASRAADGGRGLSKQAFFLLPKIAEVDAAITPAHQDRIVECHPESCFASIAGAPLPTTKRTPEGLAARTRLLRSEIVDVDGLLARATTERPRRARVDDVLDALVVAVTMRAHREGRTIVVGDEAVDARGLRMVTVVGIADGPMERRST
jgi:predicted RNase H-like nuclease